MTKKIDDKGNTIDLGRLNKSTFKKRKKRKRDGDDKQYISALHSLVCCVCLGEHVEAHHLRGIALGRGMGLKSEDRYCIPLCSECHSKIHETGTKLEAEVLDDMAGFCVLDLANSLWGSWQEHGTVDNLVDTFWRVLEDGN